MRALIALSVAVSCVVASPAFASDPAALKASAAAAAKRKDIPAELHFLEGYIDVDPAALDGDDVAERIKVLQGKVIKRYGKLDLRSGPAGAYFTLTHRKRKIKGVTPWAHWLKAGRYGLVLESPGYMSERRVLEVKKGAVTQLSISLSAEG